MNTTVASTTAAPASRLRSRPVNTTPAPAAAATKSTTKSSVSKRIASPTASVVRPRTNSAGAGAAVRCTRGGAKAVAPGRPPVAAAVAEERKPTAAARPATTPATTTVTSQPASQARRGHPPMAPPSTTTLVKSSSRNGKLVSTASIPMPSSCASRLDSVCSSLPGSSGERGSVHRARAAHPSPMPQPPVPRPAPLTRAATAECIPRSARQPAATTATHAEPKRSSTPVDSSLRSRTHSSHDFAPASRLSSVNSRLAEARPAPVSRAPTRTRVVRTAGKRSSSSGSATDGRPAALPPPAPASFAAITAPVRSTGVRPLLPASRRASLAKESGMASNVPRLRMASASAAARSASQTDAGCRSARGDSRADRSASCNAAVRGADRHGPPSARRAAGASPSRKGARKPADGKAAHSRPPPSSATAFQQTHTACPPPLSFRSCGSLRHPPSGGAASKGPVSPIKRTSTACPGHAQVYPAAAPSEDPTRDSTGYVGGAGGGAGCGSDSAYASPWLRPGMFSTPTNRDGGRESSEAPTVPYEGSTGQRASMSLSPRTDFDNMSVSGRLSYGM